MVIESDDKNSDTYNTQSDVDYTSSDLLSQWFNSLETRSSLFWLHYVECNNFCEESDESELSLTNSSDSGVDNTNCCYDIDDKDTNKNVPVLTTECKSIAHRDSELLVALTENCSHGPVCYFCRYNFI